MPTNEKITDCQTHSYFRRWISGSITFNCMNKSLPTEATIIHMFRQELAFRIWGNGVKDQACDVEGSSMAEMYLATDRSMTHDPSRLIVRPENPP